ncbi:MAG: TIGR04282 family arsenosugar biosynthesis glycosyltransferase [Usitatibacter sp.]
MGVAVFAKAPVPGAVKTRLAAHLGAERAAGLHAELARHAVSIAVASGLGPVELWCAPDETHPFFVQCAREFGVALVPQGGGDLGERMGRAFDASFSRGRALVLIGSDCPELDAEALRAAAAALRKYDAAIAPAEDGGYVLIALARPVPRVFAGIAWGESDVMERTRSRLTESRASWKELPASWDVDRPEDYERLRRSGLMREALP